MIDRELVDLLEGIDGTGVLKMRNATMSPYIEPGDRLVVRESDTAANEVAVVLYQGKATVRRYEREGDQVHLKADNPTVEDIVCASADVKVLGVVTGIVRSV